MSNYLGYSLVLLGILIIIFAFILGYGLYLSLPSSQSTYQINATGINDSVKSALENINNNVNTNLSYSIKIILFFFFASVGYKIADLGIKDLKK